MNTPSENPLKESTINPYRGGMIRKTVALVLLMALVVGIVHFYPALRSRSAFSLVVIGPVTLSALADWIGYFKFRKWKKKHPGPEHTYAEFMLEMKANNGGYTPQDFGRK